MFQFTHPVRGATISSCTILPYCVVSIHAPRAGCDRCYYLTTSRRKQFQFTHPVRGATGSRGRRKWRQRPFQFTHPVRGATYEAQNPTLKAGISIHAPRAGCVN